MGKAVTIKGSFACAHSGTAKLADAPVPVTDKRLTVSGDAVALFPGVGNVGPYNGCKLNPPPPPPPCLATALAEAPPPNPGQSGRLTVGGAPVLLDSLTADSLPAKTPVTVDAGQAKALLTAS